MAQEKPRLSNYDHHFIPSILGIRDSAILNKVGVEELYKEDLRHRYSNFWSRFAGIEPKIGSDQFVAANFLKDALNEQRLSHETFLADKLDEGSRIQREATQEATQMICGTFKEGVNQICNNLDVINNTNEKGFNTLNETTERGFNTLNNTLQDGFYDINDTLQNTNTILNAIGNVVDMGMSSLLRELQLSNRLHENMTNVLSNVAYLSSLPEKQKQKAYFIGEGLRYCAAARSSDDKCYIKALDQFQKANEQDENDYLPYYQMGYIHLNTEHNLDFKKAEYYFEKAIEELEPIVRTKTTPKSIYLLSDPTKNYDKIDQRIFVNSLIDCLVSQSICAFMQDKKVEAVALAEKAHNLDKKRINNILFLAELYTKSSDVRKAVIMLENMITMNTVNMIHLINEPELLKFSEIRNIYESKFNSLKSKVSELQHKFIQSSIPNGYSSKILSDISKKINNGNYFSLLEVDEELTKNTYVAHNLKLGGMSKAEKEFWDYLSPMKLESFIQQEIKSITQIPIIQQKLDDAQRKAIAYEKTRRELQAKALEDARKQAEIERIRKEEEKTAKEAAERKERKERDDRYKRYETDKEEKFKKAKRKSYILNLTVTLVLYLIVSSIASFIGSIFPKEFEAFLQLVVLVVAIFFAWMLISSDIRTARDSIYGRKED